jgi:hypothetical protein
MEIFAGDTTSNLVNLIHSPHVVIYEHIFVQCSRIGDDLGDEESNALSIDHRSLFLAISIKLADQFRDGAFRNSSIRYGNLVPKPDVDVGMWNT